MRRAARVDDNHAAVVKALRAIPGVSVVDLSRLGDGFPDLIIGVRRLNLLLEVKNGDKPPSKRRLTEEQEEFHATWRGQVQVVKSSDEAVEVVMTWIRGVA